MGMRPPTIRVKAVIASAPRRTGARQVAWVRRRIAEMSVPEWERPIQKTRLASYSPQKTGLLYPVTPIPTIAMYRKTITPQRRTAPAAATPRYHFQVVTRLDRDRRSNSAASSVCAR